MKPLLGLGILVAAIVGVYATACRVSSAVRSWCTARGARPPRAPAALPGDPPWALVRSGGGVAVGAPLATRTSPPTPPEDERGTMDELRQLADRLSRPAVRPSAKLGGRGPITPRVRLLD